VGTNYYLYKKPKYDHCNTCDLWRDEVHAVHIGKSSFGWCFSLRVYPEGFNQFNLKIKSLEDWKRFFNDKNYLILDEYKSPIEASVMMSCITNRSFTGRTDTRDFNYKENHACHGPNGLMRHQVDYDFCIGHGEGTWDLIARDFS
jgi:hypothetical protein